MILIIVIFFQIFLINFNSFLKKNTLGLSKRLGYVILILNLMDRYIILMLLVLKVRLELTKIDMMGICKFRIVITFHNTTIT